MMRSFDVDLLPRRGKQYSAVWRMFGEQPNAIRRLSVHEREFAYNTSASANAEQCTNVPYILPWLSSAYVIRIRLQM